MSEYSGIRGILGHRYRIEPVCHLSVVIQSDSLSQNEYQQIYVVQIVLG
jgi:hypothetical protein